MWKLYSKTQPAWCTEISDESEKENDFDEIVEFDEDDAVAEEDEIVDDEKDGEDEDYTDDTEDPLDEFTTTNAKDAKKALIAPRRQRIAILEQQ